jgi:hypothetical protein
MGLWVEFRVQDIRASYSLFAATVLVPFWPLLCAVLLVTVVEGKVEECGV